jgi:hypothetical protein
MYAFYLQQLSHLDTPSLALMDKKDYSVGN